jgi:hypothetical protein
MTWLAAKLEAAGPDDLDDLSGFRAAARSSSLKSGIGAEGKMGSKWEQAGRDTVLCPATSGG